MDMAFTDSDWESSSDSSSSEHEEVDFSYGGQAQNIFSNLEETIDKIDEFLSFERGFMCGDIVRSTTEAASGQTGRAINVNMFVNLESIHGKIIKEVDTKNLQRLRSISPCDYVINGPWLGRVDKIVERVSVTLDDGSIYEVLVRNQDEVVAIPPNLLEDSQYSYYPGQRVQVKLTHAPRSTTWLCGNWREKQVEGTVSTVEAELVYVDWVGSVIMGGDRNLTTPPQALQNPENLTLLPCVSHANWQLGDWCILPGSAHSDIAELQTPNVIAYNLIERLTTFQKGFNRNIQSSSLDELFVITKTKMKVDVKWQDGSCTLGVDSQQLYPVGAVNAHDFWPEQFVLEKETCNSKRWGIVKAVNAKEQTVKVQWRKQVEKEATCCVDEQMEEVVSAYELLEHPDFGFCFSDVVFKLLPEGKTDPNADTIVATEKHLLNESDYSGARFSSSIGVVTGFESGAVVVKWASGSTSKVEPYEIWRMEKSEFSNSSTISSEGSVQDLSHKISQSDEASSNHQETGLVQLYSVGEIPNKNILDCSSFYLPKAAIGFITNLASRLFGSQGSTSLISTHSCCNDSEDQSDSEVLVQEPTESYDIPFSSSGEVDMATMVNLSKEGKGINQTLDSTHLDNSSKLATFRQFDMVNDCSDHHFLSLGKELAQSHQV